MARTSPEGIPYKYNYKYDSAISTHTLNNSRLFVPLLCINDGGGGGGGGVCSRAGSHLYIVRISIVRIITIIKTDLNSICITCHAKLMYLLRSVISDVSGDAGIRWGQNKNVVVC